MIDVHIYEIQNSKQKENVEYLLIKFYLNVFSLQIMFVNFVIIGALPQIFIATPSKICIIIITSMLIFGEKNGKRSENNDT